MIVTIGMYLWFSAWGFFVARDMGVRKTRELLAWTILFLPILVVVSLTELVETLAVLIEGGWKGVRRRWDTSFEAAFRQFMEPPDSPHR